MITVTRMSRVLQNIKIKVFKDYCIASITYIRELSHFFKITLNIRYKEWGIGTFFPIFFLKNHYQSINCKPWVHYLKYKPITSCTLYYRIYKIQIFFIFKGLLYFLQFKNERQKTRFQQLFSTLAQCKAIIQIWLKIFFLMQLVCSTPRVKNIF